jgi:flagellar protein FliL
MNKKLINTMIVLLAAILILGIFAYVIILKLNDDGKKEPTIDEVLKVSVDIQEITTNLKNNDYVKISFKVQTDGRKAKQELEKREFQIQNLVISELSEMDASDLDGKEGKKRLEAAMKDKVNQLMQEGKIVKVYITSYIIS